MGLPKHFLKPETTRARSKKQETRIARDLKGYTTINSGATLGQNDVIKDFCEVEGKTTRHASASLKVSDWEKLKRKCDVKKFPIMQFEFEGHGHDLIVMDYNDFLYLVNKINEK